MKARRRFHFNPFPLLLLLALPVVAFLVWFSANSQPVNPQAATNINVTVNRGQSVSSIGQTLKEKNLIRSTLAFKIQVYLLNLTEKLQSGDFSLSPRQGLKSLAVSLTQSTNDRRVTFLEGWRREEIAQQMVDVFAVDNKDYAFDPDQFLLLTKDLEGQLFPDTYSFIKNVTAAQVVDRLTARYRQLTADVLNQSGLTDAQALVLASLIEREALHDSERPVVAGVLMNRLNGDWPLQVDATVQYVKTSASCRVLTCQWWPNDLTKADLALVSPYNTYLNTGLPPRPIANPSLVSIKAAYDPVTTPYWFYLHDSTGAIHFGRTIEEHNANVARYLGK